MTITLPIDLESRVQAAVRSGQFSSVDDAMAEAARLLIRELDQVRIPPQADGDDLATDPILGLMRDDIELIDEIVADAYRVRQPGNDVFYRRYISYLNDRRVDELGEFVLEEPTYNGKPMTRLDYQDLIAGNIAAIPDLYFDVALLVVEGDQIACRLNFDCTPRSKFLGLQPNGKSISFSEHVFYNLRDGKIDEVRSLLDRPAIESQMAV